MAAKFFLFKKRERLYNNIFEHLKLEMSKLIDIKTTEYIRDDRTKYLDANRNTTGDFDRTLTHNTFDKEERRDSQRITNKEKPYQYNPEVNANIFGFYMMDNNGSEKKVLYNGTKPQDFEKSEQIVLIGKMQGNNFHANDILMKCPSKYNDGKPQIN